MSHSDLSLPAWIYRDPEFLEVERRVIFRSSWQIVCHASDIPEAGNFHTLRFLGESVFVVRLQGGAVRAYHNVCRHRAARLLDGDLGHCGARITCPYHAWTYGLDGALIGVPQRADFPDLDASRHGLEPVELESFLGFLFVRLAPGGPSVAEMMEPYRAELELYRLPGLVPLGRVTRRPRAVNWKNVGDNYADALHITVAHPGLTRLFGSSYQIETTPWVDRMSGALTRAPSPARSERAYQSLLPEASHLPPDHRRLWVYLRLWPNIAFDLYPDQVDFMQFIPVSPTETLIREIAYALPDDRREMRAARYLNWRINRRVSLEDQALIERVQDGMASSSYHAGPLGRSEVCLRQFGTRLRDLIPAASLDQAPAPGWSRRQDGPSL